MKFSTKIGVSFLALSLILGGVFTSLLAFRSYDFIVSKSRMHLETLAFNAMDKFSRFMYERQLNLVEMSNRPIFRSRKTTLVELQQTLLKEAKTNPLFSSISIFDLDRIRLADSQNLNLGKQDPLHSHWQDILSGQLSTASSIELSSSLNMPTFYFAAPIYDEENKPFRALVMRVTPTELNGIFNKQLQGSSIEDYNWDLIDNSGRLLYSSHQPKGIFKTDMSLFTDHINSQPDQNFGNYFITDPANGQEKFVVFVREQGYLGYHSNDMILLLHIPSDIAFKSALEYSRKSIEIFLFFAIILALIGLWYGRKMAHPIKKLQQAVARYGKGDDEPDLVVNSNDEIGELTLEFKKMIKARKLAEDTLERVWEQSLESRKIESLRYLTEGVCHEILNPLNIMSIQIQMLSKKYKDTLKIEHSFETLNHQIDRIHGTVTSLQDLANISGAQKADVQINDLLEKTLELVVNSPKNQNIVFIKNFSPDLPQACLDLHEVMQAFYQVLQNALEAMPQGGKLTIQTGHYQDARGVKIIEVRLTDTGVGISKENLSKVMEPFYSTKPTLYRVGMGLSLCQKNIVKNGGRVRIESEEGQGTTVIFELPMKQNLKME